jgi:hypothetical protein
MLLQVGSARLALLMYIVSFETHYNVCASVTHTCWCARCEVLHLDWYMMGSFWKWKCSTIIYMSVHSIWDMQHYIINGCPIYLQTCNVTDTTHLVSCISFLNNLFLKAPVACIVDGGYYECNVNGDYRWNCIFLWHDHWYFCLGSHW